MRALLDINVLVALHDRDHVHHERAALWFESNVSHGWASSPRPLAELMAMLKSSCAAKVHQMWLDDVSLLDAARFNHAHMHSHSQLTDLYMLALAVKNEGRFASFDRRIPVSAVIGARPEHLVTL